ncbi:AraC family transcriptional regulator [Planomicrobium okeanokoites]|uniref:AraC family transcriptional regulator n=1 Tax=Planomicrobium okeanokoites TaxID=244 RepID=UPI0009FF67FC|nr:AraC family transcriptional regulator [Planomicrobium okeanokoites]
MIVKKLEYICSLIYETCEIPVFLLDRDTEIIYEAFPNRTTNPIYDSLSGLFQKLDLLEKSQELPVILTTNYQENFILLSVFSDNIQNFTIIAGPFLYGKLSKEQIISLAADITPFSKKEVILDYYHTVAVLKNLQALNVSRLLHFLVYQKEIDPSSIIEHNKNLNSDNSNPENPNLEILERRQNNQLHHDFLAEKRLFQFIKEGRKDSLNGFQIVTNEGIYGTLSRKSYLRNYKNLAISGITIATRASMEGGLYSEVAYTLSDYYIQQIEEKKSVEEIKNLLMKAFNDFADRVSNVNREHYSKSISYCLNFILVHIYEPITLDQIAKLVDLHPNYLSTLFKKEIGITFSEYLQKVKIDEAKQLLSLTNQTISEVCFSLHFVDQSYFTKVFKKQTGITPHQYRNSINA